MTARTMEAKPPRPWSTVLYYGLALGAVVVLLKVFEYNFLVRDLSVEVYVGVVAALFTVLGIWVGSRLMGEKGTGASAATMPPTLPEVAPSAQPGPDPAAIASWGISGRELEVLELMAQGRSNQEIADALFISLSTVKSHTSNLFGKLDVRRRTEAVHKARALRIIA